jgi:hypothetical protein
VTAATFTHFSPHSLRVACGVCDARGFPDGAWQDPHRRGHAPCPRCGRQLTVKLDGTPRVHTRCPRRGPFDGKRPAEPPEEEWYW